MDLVLPHGTRSVGQGKCELGGVDNFSRRCKMLIGWSIDVRQRGYNGRH